MAYRLDDNDVFAFQDSLLVIPRHEPRLFLLNPTARLVWEQLARGTPPSGIAARLAKRFEVPAARVRADIEAILAAWRSAGLLTGAAPASPPHDQAPAQATPATSVVCRNVHAARIYRLCGQPVRLRFETPEIEQAIHPPLAHSVVRSRRPAGSIDVVRDGAGYLVIRDGADVEPAPTAEDALGQVLGRILEISYPDAAWLAVMHAAAVGDDRAAVVLVGDSGSGKSTLTAALVHAGLRYFSDDVVPLDQSLRIRPLPLGISVKQGSWPVLAARYPELATLPVHQGRPRRYLPVAAPRIGPHGGLPVKSMVFLLYRENKPSVFTRLSSQETLRRLTGTRSWMSLDRRRFAATLQWIIDTPAYELRHASLEDGVRIIQRLLDGAHDGMPPGVQEGGANQ